MKQEENQRSSLDNIVLIHNTIYYTIDPKVLTQTCMFEGRSLKYQFSKLYQLISEHSEQFLFHHITFN